jgi:hypothetical protein
MDNIPPGTIFGNVDNGLVIVGAITGKQIENYLPQHLQTGLGAVYGAAIGNLISDVVGAVCDPAMKDMVLGIAIGCLMPITLIPVYSWWVNRRDI